MMNNQKLHEEVKKLARIYLESEKNLISPLIQVKQLKAYRDFECHSLDEYCEKQLGFSESVARMFQTVVNHAIRKPELRDALEDNRISVTYASKIVSQLTPENIDEVLEFTQDHSISETENWLAEKHGGPRYRNWPFTDENIAKLITLMEITPDPTKGNAILGRLMDAELERVHPLAKAKRAEVKKSKAAVRKMEKAGKAAATSAKNAATDALEDKEKHEAQDSNSHISAERSAELKPRTSAAKQNQGRNTKRIPLTAARKNAVHQRDGYRCTEHNRKGERCKETKHLHIHHIQFVSDGGSNELDNLTTLCAEHHDLAHQMSFTLDDVRHTEWNDRQGWIPIAPGRH